MVQTELRNAGLEELTALLQEQKTRQFDIVAPAYSFAADKGVIRVAGAESIIDEDGVTMVDGLYRPTRVCDDGIADKLGIHTQYMRRLRERPDLYDANVNGWLHGNQNTYYDTTAPDPRSFLLRCFRGDNDEVGIARAFLSDSYRTIDNLDVLMACLEGVQKAEADVVIDRVNLSERRMSVRFVSPSVHVLAERLLKNCRNPFVGEELERWRRVADREGMGYGGEEPILHAGWTLSNSETGDGAYTLTPTVVIKACANDLTITQDVVRSVHLGGKLTEGVVKWSDSTQQKNLELVKAKTVDAVSTFLDVDYVESVIRRLEKKADDPVDGEKPFRDVTKAAGYTKSQQDGILAYFIRGGQTNRIGVANAITAYAQTVASPDEAHDLEANAVRVLA